MRKPWPALGSSVIGKIVKVGLKRKYRMLLERIKRGMESGKQLEC